MAEAGTYKSWDPVECTLRWRRQSISEAQRCWSGKYFLLHRDHGGGWNYGTKLD